MHTNLVDKQKAIDDAILITPQFLEKFKDLKDKGGRISSSSDFSAKQRELAPSYVYLYESKAKLQLAYLLYLYGEEKLILMSPDERDALINEINLSPDDCENSLHVDFKVPDNFADQKLAITKLESLPEARRKEAKNRHAFYGCFALATFFNNSALMAHGAEMTTLVPLAIAGDDDAFLKAIQIDSMLLVHHKYFQNRKLEAQSGQQPEFLRKLLYRESNPVLKGRIEYPGLYMLFGVLDSYKCLDLFNHDEILNIADAAGLDRFQNKIDDVNYLTKRLSDYRKWQKTLQ
ncbi:hypothetical protein [Sapientia aquatica]|uniref:Uncharacterized protein n=1 Tax=Sapientia aquatica TaxID=1549640 RepID=A0A4R5W225_9BURK|nr:hypothetical protein [Sapientia aquatica]TDK65707.1 hypothetical protein E2I14_12285 [Sapientia aquatica]